MIDPSTRNGTASMKMPRNRVVKVSRMGGDLDRGHGLEFQLYPDWRAR
jgi:hypothetical protein